VSTAVNITSNENTVVVQSGDKLLTIVDSSAANNVLIVQPSANTVEINQTLSTINQVEQDVTVLVREGSTTEVDINLTGNTTVEIAQPVTNIITVATPGPAGPAGQLPDSGDFTFNGNWIISGSLLVHGQTVLTQTSSLDPALIVSGAMEMVRAEFANEIVSASLSIQGLGTFGDPRDNEIVDLGGFF
jgi:hypothetical protein